MRIRPIHLLFLLSAAVLLTTTCGGGGDSDDNGWLPIGTLDDPFAGIFEGNGHRISYLYIHRDNTDDKTGGDNIGLFGVVNDGEILNLVLDSMSMQVTGYRWIGGLAGRAINNAVVRNCSSGGQMTGNYDTGGLAGVLQNTKISDSRAGGEVTGINFTGGLVGYASSATIEYSSAGSEVAGNEYTGGLVLQVFNGGKINGSFASGPVTGRDMTGGLIGSVNWTRAGSVEGAARVLVDTNFAISDVGSTGGRYNGGLVGVAINLDLSDCFATGPVSTSSDLVGGLIGDAFINTSTRANPVNLFRCFAANAVSGSSNVGALIRYSNGASFTNSYFVNNRGLNNALGRNESPGAGTNLNPNGTSGGALSGLQAATYAGDGGWFTNWDSSVWDFGNSSQLPGMVIKGVIYRDGNADGVLD